MATPTFHVRPDAFADVERALALDPRWRFVRTPVGHYVEDVTASEALRSAHPPAAVLDDVPYRLPDTLWDLAQAFWEFRTHGTAMFNGPTVGLTSDITAGDHVATTWRFTTGGYQDSLASDILCAHDVLVDGHLQTWTRGLAIAGDGTLHDYGTHGRLNSTGASVVALTADGYVVTVRQSTRNASSGGLLAPSGSGSLEARDFDQAIQTVPHVAAAGAMRELEEETGIRAGHVDRWAPLGLVRWLEKGAKPELLIAAHLDISAADIAAGPLDAEEWTYSDGTELLSDPTSSQTIGRTDLSLPLRASLELLRAHGAQLRWQRWATPAAA